MIKTTRPLNLIIMEKPVKLIALLLWIEDSKKDKAIELLSKEFGECDFMGEIREFNITDYYAKEMGSGIQKRRLPGDGTAG